MEANLIDAVKSKITPEMIDRAAASTGEPPDRTHKAIQGAVPALLAGLTYKGSSPDGATEIMSVIQQGGASGLAAKASAVAGGESAAEPGEQGQGLVAEILGDRSSNVGEALASSSGIKSSSASRILAMVAPLVTGVLGKEVLSGGLDAGGLSQLLSRQKKAVSDDPSLPGGLAGMFGQGGPAAQAQPQFPPARAEGTGPTTPGAELRARTSGAPQRLRELEQEAQAAARSRHQRWGLGLAAVAACVLAIWGIFALVRTPASRPGVTERQPGTTVAPSKPESQGPTPQEPPGGATMQESPNRSAQGATPAPSGGVTLPGGKTIDVAPGSTEASFVHALADDGVPLPQSFRFDSVGFETGTMTLTPASLPAIDNLAAILEAYPNAQVRIGGHTDTMGNPMTNQGISESRANVLKDALVARGVAADRIETTSMGQSSPSAGNQPESEQALLRPAEIVLLSR